MKAVTLKKLIGFIISGTLAFFVDLISYWVLLLFLNTFWAKQISFVLATLASFFLNKKITFGLKNVSSFKICLFICYYLIMAWVNPAINEFFLFLIHNKILAFMLTTGCTAVLNFTVMNFIIFKKKS